MSAFAGFVALDGGRPPQGVDARFSGGLDGKGLGPLTLRRVGSGIFAFRQRILSPEDRYERQPAIGADGALVSMFDGRLDNRGELLDALGLVSPASHPVPDGDVARAAYERWGEEAVPRLLGDFAWAVWNQRDNRLMLARDSARNRSLLYSRGDGFVAFSTDYRPLLALPEIPRDLDEVAIADILLTTPDESGRSLYKAISWVGPAERIVVTPDAVTRDRFWEPAPRPTLRLARDADYVDAARAVFDQAVACRLRIAGPVVATVSGGLDSSAVATTAARQRAPGIVHGLCAVPVDGVPVPVMPYEYADERPFVATLATRHPNLQVEYLSSLAPRPLEMDPRGQFLATGVARRSPSNAAWFLPVYERAAELGATTLLQGDFGNYTFSADGFARLDALRREGAWIALIREILALRRTVVPSVWRGLARAQISRALPAWLPIRRRRWASTIPPTLFNPHFLRDTGLEGRFERERALRQSLIASDTMASVLRYVLFRSRMQTDGVVVQRTMHGVTPSDPFSDRRIFEFCLSLPDEQFLSKGIWRRLARRAFADRLSPEIITNYRRGAQNADWHARLNPNRDVLEAQVERLERSALASRILNVPQIRALSRQWPTDPEVVPDNSVPFRVQLLRVLHVGQFLDWTEGGNR